MFPVTHKANDSTQQILVHNFSTESKMDALSPELMFFMIMRRKNQNIMFPVSYEQVCHCDIH